MRRVTAAPSFWALSFCGWVLRQSAQRKETSDLDEMWEQIFLYFCLDLGVSVYLCPSSGEAGRGNFEAEKELKSMSKAASDSQNRDKIDPKSFATSSDIRDGNHQKGYHPALRGPCASILGARWEPSWTPKGAKSTQRPSKIEAKTVQDGIDM